MVAEVTITNVMARSSSYNLFFSFTFLAWIQAWVLHLFTTGLILGSCFAPSFGSKAVWDLICHQIESSANAPLFPLANLDDELKIFAIVLKYVSSVVSGEYTT